MFDNLIVPDENSNIYEAFATFWHEIPGNEELLCIGVIIKPNWILTLEFCTQLLLSREPISVLSGKMLKEVENRKIITLTVEKIVGQNRFCVAIVSYSINNPYYFLLERLNVC